MFLRRASFLKHNLWVTAYSRDEMFPGGEFPNQNPRIGDGLATWVQQNRSLEEADIVLWSSLSLSLMHKRAHTDRDMHLHSMKIFMGFVFLVLLNF